MLLIFGLRAVNLCVVIFLSASSDVSEGSVPEPAPEPSVPAFDGIPTGPSPDASLTPTPDIASITGTPEHPVHQEQHLLPSPRNFYMLPLNTGSKSGSNSDHKPGLVPPVDTSVVPTARSIGSTKLSSISETTSAVPAPASLLEPTSGIPPQGEPRRTGVTSRSYLLLLAGNATVVRLREKDFAKYLKLNLAARLSLEYDDVRVNQVLVAPSRLVVNVSVVSPRVTAPPTGPGRRPRDGPHGDPHGDQHGDPHWDPHGDGPHGDSPLHKMADTNATLLELSGEEYRIMRLVSLHPDPPVGGDLHIQQHLQDEATYSEGTLAPGSGDSRRHLDSVYVVPVLAGALCLAIVFAISLRFTAKRHYNRFWVLPKMLPKMLPKTNRRVHRILEAEDHLLPTYLAPPAVIYSGPFADHAASSRLHWLQVEETSSKLLGANLPVDMTTPKHSQLHSPSKLHIFSCRPGAVVIPLRYNHSQQSLRGNGFPLG